MGVVKSKKWQFYLNDLEKWSYHANRYRCFGNTHTGEIVWLKALESSKTGNNVVYILEDGTRWEFAQFMDNWASLGWRLGNDDSPEKHYVSE